MAEVELPAADSAAIAGFAANSGSAAGAEFVIAHLGRHGGDGAEDWLPKVGAHVPKTSLARLPDLAHKHLPLRTDLQLEVLAAASANDPDDALSTWAAEVVSCVLEGEHGQPWERHGEGESPWFAQRRRSSDGQEHPFLCSLPPGGETLTGSLRSAPFQIPERLTFFIAGHDGFPDRPAGGKNYIRIIDAEDGAEIVRSPPPRNDTAQEVTWDLVAQSGKVGIIEVVDGDAGGAYAWLAVGRFSHPSLHADDLSAGHADMVGTAATMAARYGLADTAGAFRSRLADPATPVPSRGPIAAALSEFAKQGGDGGAAILAAAAQLLAMPLPAVVEERVIGAFLEPDPGLPEFVFATAGPELRRTFAEHLAGDPVSARALVGAAPPGRPPHPDRESEARPTRRPRTPGDGRGRDKGGGRTRRQGRRVDRGARFGIRSGEPRHGVGRAGLRETLRPVPPVPR